MVKFNQKNNVSLKFITGPMFAGKTTFLLDTIWYYRKVAKKRLLVFKPALDKRFSKTVDFITNHNLRSYPTIIVANNQTILDFVNRQKQKPAIVFFDEINLFGSGFSEVVTKLLAQQINVVCAGLSKDFRNDYFPEISNFLQLKPKIKTLFANCYKCFAKATNSQRLVANSEVILVGGNKVYAPACNRCFAP